MTACAQAKQVRTQELCSARFRPSRKASVANVVTQPTPTPELKVNGPPACPSTVKHYGSATKPGDIHPVPPHICCSRLLRAIIPSSGRRFRVQRFRRDRDYRSISLDNARALPALPVSTITARKLVVTFGKTGLEDVQSAFGGAVQNDGETGNSITWLCYAAADATLWFSASTGDGTVSQVTSDADTAHAATSGCSQAPAGWQQSTTVFPGLAHHWRTLLPSSARWQTMSGSTAIPARSRRLKVPIYRFSNMSSSPHRPGRYRASP